MNVKPDFEDELKKLDSNLAVRINPENKVFPELSKIATITYQGADLFSIPATEIFDETNPQYGITSPIGNENFIPHRNRKDALMMVMVALERMKTSKDYRELILGTGVYSNAELLKKDEAQAELISEVPIELTEVGGKEEIKHESPILQQGQGQLDRGGHDSVGHDKKVPRKARGRNKV